jgi:hypothetical protein
LTQDEEKTMFPPELMNNLIVTIQNVQKERNGSNGGKGKVAQEVYQELLDGFYDEYRDMILSQQYEAAKEDPDFFIALIQLVYYYQNQTIVDSGEEQSPPYFNWRLFTQI